jgi:uncharacterized protein YndB with AHSA1/START domain
MTDMIARWRAATDRRIGADGAVLMTRRYDAAAEAVWDAWTNPERLARWLGSVSGELRPGGEALLEMTAEITVTCRITECEAPHLLAVVWCHPGEPESAGRIRLRADGEGTVLELEHARLPAELRVGYGYGWEDFLDRLGTLLMGGDPDSVSWTESQEALQPLWARAAAAASLSGSRSASGSGLIQERDQACGSDRPVRVLAQLRDLRPVDLHVEADADPAASAYVRRVEEPAGGGRDEFGLRARQPRAPQVRELVVVVARRPQRDERLLVPHEERRRAVAGALGHLGQREADRPQASG